MNDPSAWDTSGRRVFLLATASVAAHQIQSWTAEPEEGNFRAAYLVLTGLTAFSALLPRRPRGASAFAVGLPPLAGALGAHLLPILRGRPVPSASETAILNLGGAAFLVALGVSLLRTPRGEEGQEHP
jgi:hypothetical protein